MREILFRGKLIDNSEWIEGYYSYSPEIDKHMITTLDLAHPCGTDLGFYKVIPETVGQFTGVTDKNGIKIFEGDIVERGGRIWVIEYEVVFAQFVMKIYTKNSVFLNRSFYDIPSEWCEIIGNIYDNPELIKRGIK